MIAGEFNDTCSVTDIAPALTTTMNMIEEIQLSLPEMVILGNDTQIDIDLTECEGISDLIFLFLLSFYGNKMREKYEGCQKGDDTLLTTELK